MSYTYITKFTSPNQNARNTKIKSITIHHWGSRGQKFDNVVSWLCDKRAGTSAHYVVEAGKVACIVDPDRRAWHAGNSRGNHESIGIECRPEATDADYATVAELVANLRKTYGNIPLKRHKDWTSTACPGVWDIARIDRLARGQKPSAPSKPAASKPAVTKDGKLKVDGRFGTTTVKALQRFINSRGAKLTVDGKAGRSTWKALQAYLETPVDGEVSNQSYKASELGNGITQGWDYDGRGAKGSTMVKALQKWVGVKADGIWGEKTSAALQTKLNAHGVGM